MATVIGSINALKSMMTTIKQYGDLVDTQGFKNTTMLNIDSRLYLHFLKKLMTHEFTLDKSKELMIELFNSRKKELKFIVVFIIVLCCFVICIMVILIYKEFNSKLYSNVCLDRENYGSRVDDMYKEGMKCKRERNTHDNEVLDDSNNLERQVTRLNKKYEERIRKFEADQKAYLTKGETPDEQSKLAQNELIKQVMQAINSLESSDELISKLRLFEMPGRIQFEKQGTDPSKINIRFKEEDVISRFVQFASKETPLLKHLFPDKKSFEDNFPGKDAIGSAVDSLNTQGLDEDQIASMVGKSQEFLSGKSLDFLPDETKKKLRELGRSLVDQASRHTSTKRIRGALPLIENDIVVLYVQGFGCRQTDNLRVVVDNATYTMIYLCNESIINQTIEVLKDCTSLGKTFLPEKCTYCETVKGIVQHYLNNDKKVILAGFSYGGGVVSRVAEMLQKDTTTLNENIRFVTFGSIYISDSLTDNITHYMYSNDSKVIDNCHNKSIPKNAMVLETEETNPSLVHTSYNTKKILAEIASKFQKKPSPSPSPSPSLTADRKFPELIIDTKTKSIDLTNEHLLPEGSLKDTLIWLKENQDDVNFETANGVEIPDLIQFCRLRWNKAFAMKIGWMITVFILMIFFLSSGVKWFKTQESNAKKSLYIDVLTELNDDDVTDVVDVLRCYNKNGYKGYYDTNSKSTLPGRILKGLQNIYVKYDDVIDSLDRCNPMHMMKRFDKCAVVIDNFISKEKDDAEGPSKMTVEEKRSVIRTMVIPEMTMRFSKIRGMYYNKVQETTIVNSTPNIVCRELLAENINTNNLLKEMQKANIKAMEKVKVLSAKDNLIFVSVHIAKVQHTLQKTPGEKTLDVVTYTNIYLEYLYLDKSKDYDTAEFADKREFRVSLLKKADKEVTKPDEAPFIWISTNALQRSELTLKATVPADEKECTYADKCDYFLKVFDESSEPKFDGTKPLIEIVGRDQPISQLESLIMFQGHIVDAIFMILEEYKFDLNVLEYSDEILSTVLGQSVFSLIFNEMKETYSAILSEVDTRVSEATKVSSQESKYISFERFKVKFATLNSHQVCKDFVMNLLVMNSYGNRMMQHYKAHNTYFDDKYLNLRLLYDTFVILVVLGVLWFLYVAYFQWMKNVKEDNRIIQRKLDFLFNFQSMQNISKASNGDDDKEPVPPPLYRAETKREMARVLVVTIGVRICLTFIAGAMVCTMIYANHKKNYNVTNYNTEMIDSNTMKIIEGVNTTLFYLSKPNNNNENVNTFGVHVLNSLVETPSGAPSSSLMNDYADKLRYVERTIKANAASMTMQIKLGADDRELRIIYDSLVDAMISYKSGNSLMMIRSTKAMYPYVDIISNSVLLLVAVVLLLLLWRSMNPIDIIEKAREINAAIRNDDLKLIECMLQKEHEYYEINYIVIIACTVVIVFFFAVMYITKIVSSGDGFNIMLYNSPLYDNRMTYNMDV